MDYLEIIEEKLRRHIHHTEVDNILRLIDKHTEQQVDDKEADADEVENYLDHYAGNRFIEVCVDFLEKNNHVCLNLNNLADRSKVEAFLSRHDFVNIDVKHLL